MTHVKLGRIDLHKKPNVWGNSSKKSSTTVLDQEASKVAEDLRQAKISLDSLKVRGEKIKIFHRPNIHKNKILPVLAVLSHFSHKLDSLSGNFSSKLEQMFHLNFANRIRIPVILNMTGTLNSFQIY